MMTKQNNEEELDSFMKNIVNMRHGPFSKNPKTLDNMVSYEDRLKILNEMRKLAGKKPLNIWQRFKVWWRYG